jgi:hypothetical protein
VSRLADFSAAIASHFDQTDGAPSFTIAAA